jgi:hypothetical protein
LQKTPILGSKEELVIPIISVRKGKPGSKGKTSKKPGLEIVKDDYNIYDDLAAQVLEKYNMNHDARGRFAASTGGAAGYIASPAMGASSDLPSWMEEKPKIVAEADAGRAKGDFPIQASNEIGDPSERVPGYKPLIPADNPPIKKAPEGPLPDKRGEVWPEASHARMGLKPYVGEEAEINYEIQKPFDGKKGATCIQNIAVKTSDGHIQYIDHAWVRGDSEMLANSKSLDVQSGTAIITTYSKITPRSEQRLTSSRRVSDYGIDFVSNIHAQPRRNPKVDPTKTVSTAVTATTKPAKDGFGKLGTAKKPGKLSAKDKQKILDQAFKKEEPLLDADMIIETLGHLILEKYNQNHDARGRFAPSTGGAAGKISAPAGGVQSLEDALAGKPIEDQQPAARLIPVEDAKVVTLIEDQIDTDEVTMENVVRDIDGIAANAKLTEMHQVTFKELDTNVLAQCEGSWWTENGKLGWSETIAVNPKAKDYATSRYVEDHMKLQATGQMPWLASANAPDAEKAYKAVLVHEVAHAKMMEHALKSPTGLANEGNPMQGTKTWAKVVNNAHLEGWQGPSMYGRKNLGECFAESVSLLTIRGSTGHKDVDDYVVRVITE